MLNRFLPKKEEKLKITTPRHIAITMNGIEGWAKKNDMPLKDAYKKSFLILKSTIKSQVRMNIPILTFYLLPDKMRKDTEEFLNLTNEIEGFFNEMANSDIIRKNSIKISILGKWYNMPSKLVDSIKKLINSTKDYDNFFLNFCINYDGQEEIIDACKLIAMHVRLGRLDPEAINKELVKEHIYSSYFLPPDLIIINDTKKQLSDLLLWDSPDSQIYFTNKPWPDFSKIEFMDAVKEFQKGE